MTQDEVKANLLSSTQWLRMLIMVGFGLAVWVVGLVLTVVTITQTVIVLVTGQANVNLQRFGAVAAAYLYQAVNFLVYGTDDKPFPFAPFPDLEEGSAQPAAYASTVTTTAVVVEEVPVSEADVPWTDEKPDETPDPYDDLDPDRDSPKG